jgi:hypothetical protein
VLLFTLLTVFFCRTSEWNGGCLLFGFFVVVVIVVVVVRVLFVRRVNGTRVLART